MDILRDKKEQVPIHATTWTNLKAAVLRDTRAARQVSPLTRHETQLAARDWGGTGKWLDTETRECLG